MISSDDIKKLVVLSRLRVTDDGKVAWQKDLGAVLDYVDQLKAISVESGTSIDLRLKNVWRDDDLAGPAVPAAAGDEELVAAAPRSRAGQIAVKPVLIGKIKNETRS
ncbi:MAG: Asp-tRNA(Asn)/Glu-tRNA(Gln) amidotransferase subunit GatC [Patescibacteria group bacterium]